MRDLLFYLNAVFKKEILGAKIMRIRLNTAYHWSNTQAVPIEPGSINNNYNYLPMNSFFF